MSKVKVLMVEAPPGMILEWWKETFNHKPASVEDEKSQQTILLRIERQRYFLFDEKTERISIEVGYCPSCEDHIFFADFKDEVKALEEDRGGVKALRRCPACYADAIEEGLEGEEAEEKATALTPCKPDFNLLLPIEQHLRTWLWDLRKRPLKNPCAPITRLQLRKEAVALKRLKDWEDLGSKSVADPFPEEDEIEWVKDEDDQEDTGKEDLKELPDGEAAPEEKTEGNVPEKAGPA
ncbi:MAG: hypothetical protein ABID40_03630 [Candidatus Bipolaricaulota bacterium]